MSCSEIINAMISAVSIGIVLCYKWLLVCYKWLLEHSDIIGLTIDVVSLIVSVILTIAIYRLERRHEKEHEEAEEKANKLAVSESAKVFLIDNDEEVEYLHLSEIAAKVKIKRKHCRNITTRFLRCSKALQDEILRQANIANVQISMTEVETALEKLQADLEKYNFGRSILYDDAKYFHRAIEKWADAKIDNVDIYIFEDLERSKRHGEDSRILWRASEHSAPLWHYMRSYLHAEEQGLDKAQIVPPVDMVFQQCHLDICDEKTMTFWTMRIIIDSCYAFRNLEGYDTFDEALIQTQEDMYYYTLDILCKAYSAKGDGKNGST